MPYTNEIPQMQKGIEAFAYLKFHFKLYEHLRRKDIRTPTNQKQSVSHKKLKVINPNDASLLQQLNGGYSMSRLDEKKKLEIHIYNRNLKTLK